MTIRTDLAASFRRLHRPQDGTILILCAEDRLPYQRPPLSTQFLLGTQSEERLPILGEAFYREHAVDVILGTRASALDAENRVVRTDRAGDIHYGKLLIATGAAPSRLEVPGATLPGIFYLRTLDDARNIRGAAATAERAVVVGGSFIGMELAAALTQRGIHVTLLAMEDALFAKLGSPLISEFFRDCYAAHGVEIMLGDAVTGFRGAHRVEGLVTRSGKALSCDLVAVGIGVLPEVEFIRGLHRGHDARVGGIAEHFGQHRRAVGKLKLRHRRRSVGCGRIESVDIGQPKEHRADRERCQAKHEGRDRPWPPRGRRDDFVSSHD